MVGALRANQLRDRTLQTYVQAADHALTRGIIIADTKFEFGIDRHGNLLLADEIFTPDSSRYWPADDYRAGVVRPASTNSLSAAGSPAPSPAGIEAAIGRRLRSPSISSRPRVPVILMHTNGFPN